MTTVNQCQGVEISIFKWNSGKDLTWANFNNFVGLQAQRRGGGDPQREAQTASREAMFSLVGEDVTV